MKVRQKITFGVIEIPEERYRFLVPSSRIGQDPYLVDLEAHNGCGECGCPDWSIKRNILRRNGEEDPRLLLCKHGKIALRYWAWKELKHQIKAKRLAQKGRVEDE